MLGPWLVLLLYSTVMLTCAEWCWSNVCHSMCRMTRRPAPWAVSSSSSCSSSASWSALAVLSLVSTKQKQPANQRTKISSFSSCYKIILFYFQESWSTRISKRILGNVSTENFRLAVKKNWVERTISARMLDKVSESFLTASPPWIKSTWRKKNHMRSAPFCRLPFIPRGGKFPATVKIKKPVPHRTYWCMRNWIYFDWIF